MLQRKRCVPFRRAAYVGGGIKMRPLDLRSPENTRLFPLAPLMNLLEQCGLKMDVTVRSWNVALRLEPEI